MDVRFCPGCGRPLDDPAAFTQEFWSGADRNVVCWCPRCDLLATVVLGPHLVGTEPEH